MTDQTSLTLRADTLETAARNLPDLATYQGLDKTARQQQYRDAAAFIDRGTAHIRAAEEFFGPRITEAHQHHKNLLADKKRITDKVAEWVRHVKDLYACYDRHEELLRREEERRLAALSTKVEEDVRLEEAAALEEMGEHELAAQVLEMESVAPAPVIERAVPKDEAVRVRKKPWTAVYDDLAAVVVAIAAGKAPLSLVQPNQQAGNQYVRACDGKVSVPGLRAVRGETVSVRR